MVDAVHLDGKSRAYEAQLEYIVRAQREQEYLEELESFCKCQKQMGQVGTATGVNMLLLLKTRVDRMLQDSEEIPISLILAYVRTAFTAQRATEAEAQALGMEELLRSLYE